jgi:ribosome-binding ATPase YchF (GTP1/OBG family)
MTNDFLDDLRAVIAIHLIIRIIPDADIRRDIKLYSVWNPVVKVIELAFVSTRRP